MRNLGMVLALLLGVLLPAQAFPAICFEVVGTDTVILLEVEGSPAGGYYNLVGAAAFAPGVVIPLNGSAYLRQDGYAHFGAISYALAPPDISPYSVTGLLVPPSFNSGAGVVYWGGLGTIFSAEATFSAAACPARP